MHPNGLESACENRFVKQNLLHERAIDRAPGHNTVPERLEHPFEDIGLSFVVVVVVAAAKANGETRQHHSKYGNRPMMIHRVAKPDPPRRDLGISQ